MKNKRKEQVNSTNFKTVKWVVKPLKPKFNKKLSNLTHLKVWSMEVFNENCVVKQNNCFLYKY